MLLSDTADAAWRPGCQAQPEADVPSSAKDQQARPAQAGASLTGLEDSSQRSWADGYKYGAAPSGSGRRECPDRLLIFSGRHLREVLAGYERHYNTDRPTRHETGSHQNHRRRRLISNRSG